MTDNGDQRGMMQRQPVLSVRYGAFSLTLEGFEDPFATMRDVAEYFRAVLAEDRGFGARPAAPRAEALRRVAEDRSGRSVEARTGEGQVRLRASQPEAGALLDEDTEADAGAPKPSGVSPEVAANPAPTGEGADPFSAAFDEARADALPGEPAAVAGTDEEDGPEAPPVRRRPGLPAEGDEAALERLISQADSALAGPEAQRRRATFAQLKAAVAATRAETARPPGPSAAELARYRDALAQSVGSAAGSSPARRERDGVRPSAPHPPEASPRPEPDGREAPRPEPEPELRLGPVAEPRAARRLAGRRAGQRTGGAKGGSGAEPLTMAALLDEGAQASDPGAPRPGFARFLEAAAPDGALELIDAAAAYLTHVERLEGFPRLQLMRLIAPLLPGERREEVLRAFGLLLREGRLRRARRGQFQSGPRSTYTEAARRFRAQL
jgi:hypothetical protein